MESTSENQMTVEECNFRCLPKYICNVLNSIDKAVAKSKKKGYNGIDYKIPKKILNNYESILVLVDYIQSKYDKQCKYTKTNINGCDISNYICFNFDNKFNPDFDKKLNPKFNYKLSLNNIIYESQDHKVIAANKNVLRRYLKILFVNKDIEC